MTTLYGSDVSNGSLSTASTMSSNTGGTEVSQTTTVTGTLVWVEVVSRSATIASVSSIGSPSGKGWVFAPGAGTFALGNWSATVTLSASSPGTTDITIRFYKYSGGSYSSIGTINKTGITGTKTAYSFAATSMPATTFGSSDLLYVDLWWHDTSGADDNPVVYESNSATAGVASDMQVTTSTFSTVTTSSRTISPVTAALLSTNSRTVPATAALQGTVSRTVPATVALQSLGLARTIPATAAIANTFSRTVPASAALTNTLSRTIPATAALLATNSRTVPASVALTITNSRTIPASASITMSAVFYASNIAQTSGSLILSDQMSMTNGGTETSVSVTMPGSGTNSYVELLSQGGTATGTNSLPSPTGKGWSINLAGNTILGGYWSFAFTLAKSGTSMTGASLIVRAYRRTMDGTVYPIAAATLSSQTFSTAKTVYVTPSVLNPYPWQFVQGDTLYMDAFVLNPTTAWNSDVFTVYVSNSASQGVYNDGIAIAPEMITTPAGLSCMIGATAFQTGATLPVLNQSFTIADAVDQRSILTLTGEDVNGTQDRTPNQPVIFSDHDQGKLYDGYLASDKVTRPAAGGNSAQLEHMMTFADHHRDYDKEKNTTNYSNWSAGDIACDFIQQQQYKNNIWGEFAMESDYTPATLGAGTLSGTVATTTTSPFTYAPNTATPPITSNTGDLELVRAGTQFTLTESVTSDFSSGTLTNMVAANNELSPTTQSAVKFQVQLPLATTAEDAGGSALNSSFNTPESLGNSAYAQIWSGSMTVGTSDTLNYDIWISSSSPSFMAAVDLKFSDGTTLSSHAYGVPNSQIAFTGYVGLWDQNNTSADFLTDLSNYAKDAWYTRQITLTGLNGKTVTSVSLAIIGSAVGTHTIYVKNCYLGSQSGSPFFSTSATVPQVNPPTISCVGGYVATTGVTSVVNVFRPAQSTRISPAHPISGVGLVQNSTITWTASLPTSSSVVTYPPGTSAPSSSSSSSSAILIYVSYDAVTWLLCTNQSALPGLPPGANVSGLSLYLREQFQAGSDPTTVPALLQVNITVNSAAAQTTNDVVAAYGNATEWNTGTYSGTTTNSNGDLVNGGIFTPNWSGGTFDWTMHQTGTHASLSTSGGVLTIFDTGDSGSNNLAVSFDDVSPLMNGTIECDVLSSSAGTNQWSRTGIIYRGGNWAAGWTGGSGASSYDPLMAGYLVTIQADTVNSTMFVALVALSPSATPTVVDSYTTTISQNTYYHLKVIFENNRHTVYFNNSTNPIIDILDNTYVGAGTVGVSSVGTAGNSTNSQATSKWKNYTLTPLGNGTWQSASISLSSLGTCGYTQISWAEQGENGYSQSTAIVLASTNGGSTWKQCNNGAEIPQLPVGTSVSGVSLLIQVILFTSTYITTPALIGLYIRICGNYGTVSGTRISPALNLSPVGYVGSSNCMWNANIPTSTSLTVQTTQDLSTFHTVGSNGAGEALPYWTNQPTATQDLFNTVTSSNYTSTSKTGGSVASVTYTTTNSSLTLTGGSGALYLNNAISCSDVDLLCHMDKSDAGGFVWHYIDGNNFYELGVYDTSSSGGFTNQLRLYKVVSGTRSLLGSAAIVFTRGTLHCPRVKMEGELINVYWDGTCLLSYLDTSPLAGGACGLRNDGGTSRYYQLWIQPLGQNLSGQVLYTKTTLTTSDPSQMPQLFTLVASVRGPSIGTGATIEALHPVTQPFAAYYSSEMDTITQASSDTTLGPYYWYVDKWKQLHFRPRLARPGAFPVQSTTDQDPANPANVHSGYLLYTPQVSVLSAADLLRNQQVITNVSSLTTPPPEVKVSDGSTTSWTMGYPLYSAPVVAINGQPATVGLQGVDNNRQFYWQHASASISYDSSLPKLPAGTVLTFTYTGQSPANVILDNLAAQSVQAALELNSGIIAEIESALQATTAGMTTSQATTFGNGLLARFGNNAPIELIGTTQYAGLIPGTVIGAFVPEEGVWNAQLPVVKLTTMAFMTQNGLMYFRTVDATNGPSLNQWTRVWRS